VLRALWDIRFIVPLALPRATSGRTVLGHISHALLIFKWAD
jgi:hypothetical protein